GSEEAVIVNGSEAEY
ncbi:MAG: hypothetical protein EZS28_021981, partial [Streblomastix strix]